MEGTGFAAMVGVVVGAIVAALANVGIPSGILITAIFAVASAVVWIVGSLFAKRRKDARAKEAMAQSAERGQREANARALSETSKAAQLQAEFAVSAFRRMSDATREIDSQILEARRYRADGAFSPFWSAIERAFVAAGEYRNSVAAIDHASKDYVAAVTTYAQLGGNPQPFAQFPVKLAGGEAQSVITARLDELGRLVYDAQREPTFAQIWEQRRTTAAVISGFANLEDAVGGMARSLSSSIEALTSTTKQSQSLVSAAVDRLALSSTGASQAASAEMARLSRTAEKIHDEMFREAHGRYPLL